MDSLQLLTLNLHFHLYFQVEKAKINLHTTPKLTVVIPISCLLPCPDPGIFRGGGGGGVQRQYDKNSSDSVVCLFFAFFLVHGLVNRSQMVNFKEKYHFSRFRRGSKFFQGGPTLSRGGVGESNCLFPIETQITCDFKGGPDPLPPPPPPPPPPLDPHLAAIYLVSQSAK